MIVTSLAMLAAVLLCAPVAYRCVPARRPPDAGPTTRAVHGADEWATVLDAVAAEVRAGSSLLAAWAAVHHRRRLDGRHGIDSRTVDEFVAATAVDDDEAIAIHAIAAAHDLGGPVAATLDTGAALLRERLAMRADARLHSAQARLSAHVLTVVPLAFAVCAAILSRSFRAALATTPGALSFAAGLALNAIGRRWMTAVVRAAAP